MVHTCKKNTLQVLEYSENPIATQTPCRSSSRHALSGSDDDDDDDDASQSRSSHMRKLTPMRERQGSVRRERSRRDQASRRRYSTRSETKTGWRGPKVSPRCLPAFRFSLALSRSLALQVDQVGVECTGNRYVKYVGTHATVPSRIDHR